jgi:sugar phosphate isomerase/epimerase
MDHYERVAAICGKLGISTIVFGSPKARHLLNTTEEDAIQVFKQLGSTGEKHNVVCCVEPNAKAYGCTWLTNLADTVDFIKKVDHPFVRITYDLGNYLMEKDTFEWDSNTIQYIGHVQVSNEFLKSVHTLSSDNVSVYSNQLHKIIALGYSKRVSMEMVEAPLSDLIQSVNLFASFF